MRKVCFSTGNFYIPGKTNLNKEIKKTIELGVDGVEVTIGRATDMRTLKLDKKIIKELRKLNYNAIHAPFYLFQTKTKNRRIYYWNSDYYKRLLKKMHRLYDNIEAVNMNFHPNLIKNFKLLENNDYNYSIENMTPHWNNKLSYYKKILDKYPHINFLLDTSHATLCKELDALVKKFKKRITHVHLSNVVDEKEHSFLHDSGKNELKKLNVVKKLNVPFIIETWYENEEAFKLFKKEVNFVRKWLK